MGDKGVTRDVVCVAYPAISTNPVLLLSPSLRQRHSYNISSYHIICQTKTTANETTEIRLTLQFWQYVTIRDKLTKRFPRVNTTGGFQLTGTGFS